MLEYIQSSRRGQINSTLKNKQYKENQKMVVQITCATVNKNSKKRDIKRDFEKEF